jgi:hypothetical protein
MALNTRPVLDPRWVTHHSPVEDGFALAYIEIFKPNNGDKVYNATTNTWTVSATTLYKGWARIQPNRPFTTAEGSNDFVPASTKDVAMFFNIMRNDITGFNHTVADIRPGHEVKVTSAPADAQMKNFTYVVKSVINSSNTWSRGIVCEVNQETAPNYA